MAESLKIVVDNNLIHGDCLEEMKNIQDQSIDIILTDPPYGTTACIWDNIIPLKPMWKLLKRIIKLNGAIVLSGNEPFGSHLRISNLDMYKYDWTWIKSRKNGFVHAKGMPLRETELILVFSQGSIRRNSKVPMKYNPQGVIPFEKKRINYVRTTQTNIGGNKLGTEYKQIGYGYPTNLIFFKNVSPTIQIHPTQKPVALMEYLIKTYTNLNDLVLDFTMGSGTTGVACKNLSRNFIGIEINKRYYKMAEWRINGH